MGWGGLEDELEITICMYFILQKLGHVVNNWFVTLLFPLSNVIGCHFMSWVVMHYMDGASSVHLEPVNSCRLE